MDDKTKDCACSGDRRLIGKVTPKERDEIQALFERRNGLVELIRSLAETDDEVLKNGYFYEKIVADMGKTTTRHQQWWDRCAKQYQWESVSGYIWEIDFEACQIFLRKT
ncbi:MAG: CXXX repeat peptide modification system protein [Negativicutes bacterium]|nr:CXXX repeat peptide modification system protein [Negativicutes bacterium]